MYVSDPAPAQTAPSVDDDLDEAGDYERSRRLLAGEVPVDEYVDYVERRTAEILAALKQQH